MTTSSKHHTIDYIELTVTDLGAATAFYAAAFGWRFNDYGPEYAGIVTPDGEGEVGGLNATGQCRVGGSPLVLLYSDELDLYLELGPLSSARRAASSSGRSRPAGW